MNEADFKRRPVAGLCIALTLVALLPFLLGGCPEFRNSSVDAVDSATRSVVLGDTTEQEAADAAALGVLSAALDLFFDQFRTDELR